MNQVDLATDVIDILKRSGEFETVKLSGSLCGEDYDAYSDIDILLTNNSRSPWENVQLASDILCVERGSILKDWAGSLIPQKYLISHFLLDYPLFWWIDIGCFPTENYSNITRNDIFEDRDSHIAKLLIMNTKYFIRRDNSRLRIRELYLKITNNTPYGKTDKVVFETVYQTINFSKLSTDIRPLIDRMLENIFFPK